MLTVVLKAVNDVVLQILTVVLKAVKDAVYKGHIWTMCWVQPPANTKTYPSEVSLLVT